jgi:AAA15 family ATPase/GTPase
MLKSLHIKNFRGFRDLKIESLKRVNLITGRNNTGKTGVLEALAFLLNDPNPSNCAGLPNLFRITGVNRIETFWKWLISDKASTKNLRIDASFTHQDDFSVVLQPKLEAPDDFDVSAFYQCDDVGGFNCFRRYIGGRHQPVAQNPVIISTKPSTPFEDALDYNRVVFAKRNKKVEEMLRQIEPRLLTIEAEKIFESRQTPTEVVVADIGLNQKIPVSQLGQGFNRLLNIYSKLVVADAKVLLIDEIENGLHYSVLPTVWKGLLLAAKEFDVQIFATTHSWECILAADQAAREQANYELELIRLDRVKEDIKATIIDGNALETAKELGWEMR